MTDGTESDELRRRIELLALDPHLDLFRLLLTDYHRSRGDQTAHADNASGATDPLPDDERE